MPNNMVVGYNVGLPKDDIDIEDTPISSTNANRVTCFNPLQSHVPGALINPLLTLTKGRGAIINMKTVADFTSFFATSLPEIAPVSPVALSWIQLANDAVNVGDGSLTLVADLDSTANNAGGTASGKLTKATGNYVEFTLSADLINSTGVILGLSANNNGSYIFATDVLLAGTYVYQPTAILKYFTGNGTADGTAASSVVGNKVVRLEISGDDVLLKYDGATVHTYASVLAGVSNIWIKTLFAGTQPNDRILKLAKAIGMA